MDEIFAVNHTEITQALFYEGAQQPLAQKYRSLTLKIGCILLAAFLLLALLSQVMGGDASILAGELFLLLVVLVWVRFILPRTERKRAFQAMERNGSLERITQFRATALSVQSGNSSVTVIPYNEITGFRTTKHLLILTRQKGPEVLLVRDGFSTGTEDDVLDRIRNHQPS